jgi:hypothetical protein
LSRDRDNANVIGGGAAHVLVQREMETSSGELGSSGC